jgi:hypothetical protein
VRPGRGDRAGLGKRLFVERLPYARTPADGKPERPHQMRLEQEPEDGAAFDVLCRIGHGSLDAHERRAMA